VPNYFDNTVTNFHSSIVIDVPHIWPSPKMLGFDGCIVVSCGRPFHIRFSPFSYDWDWDYERYFYLYLKPDLFHFPDSSFHSTEDEEEAVKSDHLVIIRGLKNFSEKLYKFGIQSNFFSNEFESSSAVIQSAGLRLIWEDKSKTSRLFSLFKYGKLKKH